MGDENRELHYIFADTGIAAIMQRKNSVDSMFYVHPDHLGSLVLITDENGNIYEEKSFDAFGRMRDPEDWGEMIINGNYKFDRGFTGHEHLDQFGLINMNGRMYDPHTARFLSPDLFVQYPSYTQSFNRYSYCLNNPLRFVDPTGYWSGRVFDHGQTEWQRELHKQHRHLDGGYYYDPSSPTGYRNAAGDVVSWWEVNDYFVRPNSTPIDNSLFGDVLFAAKYYNLSIVRMYEQDWFVSINKDGKLTTFMGLTTSGLNSYLNPHGQEDDKSLILGPRGYDWGNSLTNIVRWGYELDDHFKYGKPGSERRQTGQAPEAIKAIIALPVAIPNAIFTMATGSNIYRQNVSFAQRWISAPISLVLSLYPTQITTFLNLPEASVYILDPLIYNTCE